MAIVAVVAGVVADRLIARGGDPIKVRKGFTIAGLAVASTQVIGVMSGSPDLAIAFSIISLTGLGLATANYWALTQSLMPGAAIGRIAGVQNFASNLSGIVAPWFTGWLVRVTGSFEAPMQFITGLLLAGILAYLFLVKREYAPACTNNGPGRSLNMNKLRLCAVVALVSSALTILAVFALASPRLGRSNWRTHASRSPM